MSSAVLRAPVSRRFVLTGLASVSALGLAGCATTAPAPVVPAGPVRYPVPPDVMMMYAARPEEEYPVPAADVSMLDPTYWRQEVANPTGESEGKVVVDTANYFLYWTMPNGRAMRYGVGLGRAGFEWRGRARIAYKRKWPVWTPPSEMVDRQPELEIYRNGQPPGLLNALGARALYIHQDGKDTLYRVHGTMDVATIGKAVSSGCVRMIFQDVMDLYDRVPSGSEIVVG